MSEKIFIDVVDVIEEENGGATIVMKLNEPAREFLIQEGVLSILRNKISGMEGFDEKDTVDRTCCSDVVCRCGDGYIG